MRILLIGALNINGIPRGGEEVKNRIILEYFINNYEVCYIDTFRWKFKPIILFKLLLYLHFKKFDKIIVSASSKSVYRLLGYLNYFSKIVNKTYYFVIGGYFPKALLEGKFKIKRYNSLAGVLVEGEILKETLMKSGFQARIAVLPNFKKLPNILISNSKSQDFLKFVFLSRIHPDKGVREIIEANNYLKEWDFSDYTITFYGPIEKKFEHEFNTYICDNVYYKGVLNILTDIDSSYDILSDYNIMLFPTFWKGEGFPGAIIDAFISGLPVIATKWNMNEEIIEINKTGFLVEPRNSMELALSMRFCLENKDLIFKMRQQVLAKSKSYDYNIILSQISLFIDL